MIIGTLCLTDSSTRLSLPSTAWADRLAPARHTARASGTVTPIAWPLRHANDSLYLSVFEHCICNDRPVIVHQAALDFASKLS